MTTSTPLTLQDLVPTISSIIPVVLNGASNYGAWRPLMRGIIKSVGTFDILNGSTTCPQESLTNAAGVTTPNPDYKKWVTNNELLKICVMATISQTLVTEVSEYEHASQMWILFEKRYTTMSQTQVFNLHSQLDDCTLKNFTNLDAYLAKIKEISGKLTLAREPLSQALLIHHTLKGLPSEYNVIKACTRNNRDTITFDRLVSDLQEEEIHINREAKAALQSQPSESLTAYQASTSNSNAQNNYNRGRGGRHNFRGGRGGRHNNSGGRFITNNFNPNRGGGRFLNFNRGGRFFRGRRGGPCPNNYNQSTGVYCSICNKTNHHTDDCWFNEDNYCDQGTHHTQANAASSSNDSDYNSLLDSSQ